MVRRHRTFLAGVVLAAMVGAAPGASGAPDTSGTPVVDGVPLCGAEGTGSAKTIAAGERIKVASFNLLHSDTKEGDQSLGARLPLEADDVARSGADVVGLQEVTQNVAFAEGDEFPQRHGLVAQRFAQALAARTGDAWQWCFYRSNPHVPLTQDVPPPGHAPGGGNPLDDQAAAFGNFPDGGDFAEGLAIVTRFDIKAARSHRLLPRSYEAPLCLPQLADDQFCPLDATFDTRQVLWARIETGAGAIDMFDTHLAHGITELSDTTKLLQAQQVLAQIEMWSDKATPDFLTGDFNSAPDTDRVKAVTDAGFTDTYAAAGGAECAPASGKGCTGGPPEGEEVWTAGNARAMSERIDYVFNRGCDTKGTGIIGANAALQADGRWLWPSDHLGIVSELACFGDSSAPTATTSEAKPADTVVAAGTAGGGGADKGPLPVTGGAGGLLLPALTALAAATLLRRRPWIAIKE